MWLQFIILLELVGDEGNYHNYHYHNHICEFLAFGGIDDVSLLSSINQIQFIRY